jgi:YfiH family protein
VSGLSPSDPLQARFDARGLDWIVPEWPSPANVRAFSTTRNGEAGTGFDLSQRADSSGARIKLRRWLPKDPLWLAQVHGADVVDIDRMDAASSLEAPPRADAAVARSAGSVCAVLAADCMPVLFTDRGGSVVAAAHAGWRGIAAGVLEAALAAMATEPRGVIAWLGPAIGPRVFEVGVDVLEAHCASDPGAAECFLPQPRGKWLADLYALARRRLKRAGVTAIYGGGRCTFSEREVFFSYRRGGAEAGSRMATLIWREEP